jgi:hypothetical protein
MGLKDWNMPVSAGDDMSKNEDINIGLPGIAIGSSLGFVRRRRDSLDCHASNR